MTPKEFIADNITSSTAIMEMTLADFSDAELLKRPAPAANHALWQLGHLAKSDVFFANLLGAGDLHLPAGWDKKFTKETAKSDNPADFAPKAESLALMKRARAAAAARVRQMSDEDLNKPGPENIRQLCPTLGHAALIFSAHAAMHVGQFQVLRRSLNKPVLF